jgi:hypothetical protein
MAPFPQCAASFRARPQVCLELFDALARRNACRFHLIEKPVNPRIAGQALDIGVNLCLPCPPCGIGGVF